MKLPTCATCQHSFSYQESIQYYWKRKCPACETKQYLTTKSNVRTSIPTVVFILFPGFVVFNLVDSFWIYTCFAISFLIITLLVLPFFFEFSNERQALF
ncbi:hypothetical protein AJ85_20575 [Alkalihalobacillus alcalophilus ATCC 27647 = CGMCC 1.3604]|uniref:Cxxc_20_cxxc protein n=1 Tax=Alkalihalobacillus alcalophilus ATCC 27647 = CGMCC 1.3604 TaxID=1218173 RepID=A0A094WPD5_ALKAL|nr:TIGR04104 family putative zinc finger protein [Alkalihalobacillus alcalophilus]KGA97863.1 hypothetical protein BALCAV_0207435 [Alkalihalobacillus alcalophilus ATCC 27647 = CGMCC 1.3604]MED1562108.1 hypothetical protein [Alkalihalobacillus alcalophilus]THG88917.1 hypothetical protein AJ85_20575 [Alkalihalobacillus alcalophilus ATCC 27647 = CGMCC 1.3604]